MVEWLSNPEIADRFVIGLATARFHVSNILSRPSMSARTETVALAPQEKLV